jgi:branched-chain amino acid aminotransferase
MQTTEYIWQNGKFLPWTDAKTHVLTHSLHYGAAVFEGMRAYLTSQGSEIYRLSDHIKRFFYSASVINMKLPYPQRELEDACRELIDRNKLEECYVRPIAYFGYGKMGVDPKGAPTEVAIACWPWDDYAPHSIMTMKTNKYLRISPEVTVPGAKISGNYLNSILGILELKNDTDSEPLFLDVDGYVAESSGANFFSIKDGIIFTPKPGSILLGITRDTVFKIAKKLNLKVVEANLSLEEARAADEVFLTGTAIEIMPIKAIDGYSIGRSTIGPITKEIQQMYHKVVHGVTTL